MLINRVESINRLIESGNSFADVIELLQSEPDKADIYREAFAHAIGILELMPSQNVAFAADLKITGAYGDLCECGNCGKTIGVLETVYSNFDYCPFCSAKLNKGMPEANNEEANEEVDCDGRCLSCDCYDVNGCTVKEF